MVLKNLRKSTRKTKKYMIDLIDHKTGKKKRTIHFGAIKKDGTPYNQFKDSTGLGLYSKYDHKDKDRKARYYKRHNKSYGRYSADALSKKYLW
tara:strand:+ start:7435 stop:7713 length:279 start_codon:yes stop_codon:yes gene_type:complete